MYNKKVEKVFEELGSNKDGLKDSEASKRLGLYGKNEIKEKKKISPIKIFFDQFKSFIVGILIAAVIISAVLGEYIDAAVIGVILILNAVLGFVQEFQAEKAIEALKKMASLKATVVRNGAEKIVDAAELVPGDVIMLEVGNKVPADSRLFEVVNLESQEAALTGESVPVRKIIDVISKKVGVVDRTNMVFSGTVITKGRGKAVVANTGMKTEIGNIATMIQEGKEEKTHLQKQLGVLGKRLGYLTIAIVLVVFFTGLFLHTGEGLELFLIAVALAVAAIPEGLPAVVTISLALSVKRMVKKNALIRKLPSVETLGATTVICSDKTGTLTHNQMTVKKLFVNNKVIDVEGEGYKVEGEFLFDGKRIDVGKIELLLKAGVLCNDAQLSNGDVIGDPTEGCLIVSAAKGHLNKHDLNEKFPRVDEIGFSSERKRMTTLHKGGVAYMKGAPDVVLKICSKININGKIRNITAKDKKEILGVNDKFAKSALRVLGLAYKEKVKGKISEKDFVFIGLQAMIDPPRKEAKEAIARCHKAGIKVMMITGDHITTAKAIADWLGIKGRAVVGADLDKINLDRNVENIAIYARVNPAHKMKIVDALKKKGHVVAMTGDGVNDAPALKKADIGIAMGITGTDVSKEASDMILTDDNFASIVNAVEEGRGIFDNIRKFVNYLLSCNIAEVLIIFFASIFAWRLPLVAVQILWINLVTDGLPAIALGVDPTEKGVMNKNPRDTNEKIINKKVSFIIIFVGIIIAAAVLAVFKYYDIYYTAKAQTVAFTLLVMLELVRLYIVRRDYNLGLFSNKWVVYAVLSSLLLQLVVVYSPLGKFFDTVFLGLFDWGLILVVSAVVYTIANVGLWVFGRINRKV